MYFTPIDEKDIPKKTRRVTSCQSDIVSRTVMQFMFGDDDCAELFDDGGIWANSNNFRRSFQSYLDDHNIKDIIVTIRGDRVFLIKRNSNSAEVVL